jgi:aminoglycoside 6'-N-acetyltransferase I
VDYPVGHRAAARHDADPGYIGVALFVDDQIAAAALGHVERWYSGNHFYLREMFVRPALQRHGYGERLLSELSDRLPAVAVTYLLTDADTPAFDFYQRQGFLSSRQRVLMTRRN